MPVHSAFAFFSRQSEQRLAFMLFFLTAIVYLCYYHEVILHPNDLLSSITLDSIKNYFTFAYHIKNDDSWIDFRGMNYPYGEHFVYTDCQPLLTLLLRPFTFAHEYSAAVINLLMFASYFV